jgi:hypothetical protein
VEYIILKQNFYLCGKGGGIPLMDLGGGGKADGWRDEWVIKMVQDIWDVKLCLWVIAAIIGNVGNHNVYSIAVRTSNFSSFKRHLLHQHFTQLSILCIKEYWG